MNLKINYLASEAILNRIVTRQGQVPTSQNCAACADTLIESLSRTTQGLSSIPERP